MTAAEVNYDGADFTIVCEYWDNQRVKMAPDKIWNRKTNRWLLPAVHATAKFIEREYEKEEIHSNALAKIVELKNISGPKTSKFPVWYKFKTPPMPHQKNCLDKLYGSEEMALFMWMGRGKTWTFITIGCALAMEGKINAMLIICPSGVKPVWEPEWGSHGTVPAEFHIMESGYRGTDAFIQSDSAFKILVVGIEALSQGKGYSYVERFCLSHRVSMGIDESSDIKNPKSIRTQKCWNLGGFSLYRSILTGTEITEGIENLFSQYRFLNWQIIGHKSYYTFTSRYCIFGGFENRKIVGYSHIKELMEAVEPYTFSIGKDVKGLPPKIYKPPIKVKATAQQNRAFRELKEHEYTEIDIDGEKLELITETILERTMRYQQICGGSFPFDIEEGGHGVVPIPGKNPKLDALMAALDDISSKAQHIIWAAFIPEIKLIKEALIKKYGEDAIDTYIGGSSTDERIAKIKKYQEGETRFMVANKSMSKGVTVTACSYNWYFSNGFSYEGRIQSEERSHRKGTVHTVTYTDIIIDHPVEARILKALREKKSLAEYIKNELGAYNHDL